MVVVVDDSRTLWTELCWSCFRLFPPLLVLCLSKSFPLQSPPIVSPNPGIVVILIPLTICTPMSITVVYD